MIMMSIMNRKTDTQMDSGEAAEDDQEAHVYRATEPKETFAPVQKLLKRVTQAVKKPGRSSAARPAAVLEPTAKI